jgi:hypothetical protein
LYKSAAGGRRQAAGGRRQAAGGGRQAAGGRRAEGWGVIAACVVCLVGAGSAPGQVVGGEDWHRLEFLPGSTGLDEVMAVAYWDEGPDPITGEPRRWAYATGYHTTESGARVMATYKYDATHTGWDPPPPLAAQPAFYPPEWQNAVGDHQSMAITVDQHTGDVYITGWSTAPERTDRDYLTIRYDKNLVGHDSWLSQGGEPNGVRRWNSPNDGDDWSVDLAFNGSNRLAVTGTSNGFGTGNDIVTLLYNTDNGGPAWRDPECTVFELHRRWNNLIIANSPDTAVKVGILTVVVDGQDQCNAGAAVVVAGRTWNGQQNGYDFITLFYNQFGELTGQAFYDGPAGGDDFCRDLSWYQSNPSDPGSATIIVGGTSQHHPSAFGGPPPSALSGPEPPNTDYAIVTYDFNSLGNLIPRWSNVGSGPGVRLWDGPAGKDDHLTGVAFWKLSQQPTEHVWATGYTREGSFLKLSTIVFDLATTGPLLWEHVHSEPLASETGAWAIHIPVSPLGIWGHVYVAGWAKINSAIHTLSARYNPSNEPPFALEWVILAPEGLFPNWANAVVAADVGDFSDVFTGGAGQGIATGQDFKFTKLFQQEDP